MADLETTAVLAPPLAAAAATTAASASATEEPGLFANVYTLPRLEIRSGHGARVVDAAGREYIDFVPIFEPSRLSACSIDTGVSLRFHQA